MVIIPNLPRDCNTKNGDALPAKAIKKNKDAKHVNEDANHICKRAETQADMARAKTQKSLEDLLRNYAKKII